MPFQVYAQGIYVGDQTDGVAGLDWILVLIQNVLAVALRLVGVAAFIMFIVGSYKMLASGGNPDSLESGKKTFGMAIGGLVVAALAYFLFKIISDITGVEGILNISIPELADPPGNIE